MSCDERSGTRPSASRWKGRLRPERESALSAVKPTWMNRSSARLTAPASISGNVATWAGTTSWFNPGDSTTYYDVPLELRLTITGLGATPWALSTSIPGLDPGPGSGIGAVVDNSAASNFSWNAQFLADIPTDGTGNFIALNTVPTSGGTSSSFGGGFYSVVP